MTKEDALWLELKQSLQTNTCQEGMITDHFSIIQCAGVQAVVVEEGRPTFICKSMCRVAVVSLMSVLGTSLLCMYAKCGSRYDACRVFQQDAHLHSMWSLAMWMINLDIVKWWYMAFELSWQLQCGWVAPVLSPSSVSGFWLHGANLCSSNTMKKAVHVYEQIVESSHRFDAFCMQLPCGHICQMQGANLKQTWRVFHRSATILAVTFWGGSECVMALEDGRCIHT